MRKVNPYDYYVGVDLGQSQDYTALAVLEEPAWDGSRWVSPREVSREQVKYWRSAEFARAAGRPSNPPLRIPLLRRFPLGTPYPHIVDRVSTMLSTPPFAGRPAALLVDKGGVGAGVVDQFRQAGLRPYAVTIHGGGQLTPDDKSLGYRVPKKDLVAAVQVAAQNDRLKIAPELPEASLVEEELRTFRYKMNPHTAHESYEHWRENDHDDLVLAVAFAVWYREWFMARVERYFTALEREPERFEDGGRPVKGSREARRGIRTRAGKSPRRRGARHR